MAAIDAVPHVSYGDTHHSMSDKGKAVRTLVEADLLDERYTTTKRGLKNRHVQLMALGGTIGTGKLRVIANKCHSKSVS
jgi:amino acid transporter